ncbi:type II secretion system F family protein [Isoptericola sp. NPDC019693]|uniref:type II secretion system F family protein n=1 Tax=Isoptericola sp. NPDC019693 TaxID=3364009 RepID=UPI00378F2EB7
MTVVMTDHGPGTGGWTAADLASGPGAVGLWVGLAVWLVLVRGGRRPDSLVRPLHPRSGSWSAGLLRRGRHESTQADAVRVAVAQVVALLRAGAPPAAAWSRALGVPADATGVPDPVALAPVVGGAGHARSVVAAAVLARDVGAPLASVLDAVSGALVAEAEARGEREASLAGPRATARVLMWLPLLGAALGWVLGADPVATAVDGGVGSVAVCLGLLLLAAGWAWTRRLVASARAAGEAA